MLRRDEDTKAACQWHPERNARGRSGEHWHCFELLQRLSMHLCDADDSYDDGGKVKLE